MYNTSFTIANPSHYSQVDERRDSIPEEPEMQPIETKRSKSLVTENNGTLAPGTIGWKKDIAEVENT